MTTEASPKPRQRVSRRGLELIKSFEGLRRKSARLPGGRYVVGYGHIRSTREGVEVSESDAEALLRYDLLPVEAAVNEWTFAPLTQNQFDALVSFAFNIGVKTFRRSEVLRRINEGAMLQAAAALEMWRRADLDGEGVIVDALVRRRAAEVALFLHPADGHIPAPSAVLRPRIDTAARSSAPSRRPEQVATPLDGADAVAIRAAPEARRRPEGARSPVEAAAANVSARLSEILGDEPPAQPDLPYAPGAEVEGDLADADIAEADLTTADLVADEPIASDSDQDELAADDSGVTEQAEVELVESYLDEADEAETGFTEADVLDGDFMQAPPSPPQAGGEDDADETFPELDLEPSLAAALQAFADDAEEDASDPSALASEAPPASLAVPTEPLASATAAEASPAIDPDSPVVELSELPPFPDDADLPPHVEPADQAQFDDLYEPEPEPSSDLPEGFGQHSGALPSQGDPGELAKPAEGPDNGPYIYLFLASLALVVAAAVIFFRTPDEGAATGSGLGWVLGLLGVAGVAGSLWLIMGREDAIGDDPDEG